MSKLPAWHEAVPIADFRAMHHLEASFSVATLFPKDFAGLGTASGLTFSQFLEPLNDSLTTWPHIHGESDLSQATQTVIATFHTVLADLNQQAGLTLEQLEFAEAGFADLLWHCVYAVMDPRTRDIDMSTHVANFVAQSLHRSSEPQSISVKNSMWQVSTVSSLYGRVGLLVEHDDVCWLVRDEVYTCPMVAVMNRLVIAVARSLQMRYSL